MAGQVVRAPVLGATTLAVHACPALGSGWVRADAGWRGPGAGVAAGIGALVGLVSEGGLREP